jgi:prolyl-tRNA editing enzyme YbaK/EbsC (Cys-tRNA(Pro) deacylase)
MSELLRNLNVIPESEYGQYLPRQVAAELTGNDIKVFLVDSDASDTTQFSERYGFSLADCANTIVLRYRKDGEDYHAAVVTLGSRRLDINGAVKAELGAQRLSFAKREVAVELTGMEFGGITAFGAPRDWVVLVDEAVMQREQVVMGAGVRAAKLLLSPNILSHLPNVNVAALASDVS